MLKVLRNKNVAKAVLWALLILILPAFVLWGTGSLGRSDKKGPSYAGIIENNRVSFDDFAQSMKEVNKVMDDLLESLKESNEFMREQVHKDLERNNANRKY